MINGPNLNLLGKRKPRIYGSQSFEEFFEELKTSYPQVSFNYYQSNVECELIIELQRVGFDYNGIVLNPGVYTHTSVTIGDAIAAIKTPVVEVHISNVHAREDFRKISHVSGKAVGSIAGLAQSVKVGNKEIQVHGFFQQGFALSSGNSFRHGFSW